LDEHVVACSGFESNGVGFLKRYDDTGAPDPFFVVQPDAAVRAVAAQDDGSVFMVGDFVKVNGTPRSYLARLRRIRVPPPHLRAIPQRDGTVLVAWPVFYRDYFLQMRTPNGWRTLTNSPSNFGRTLSLKLPATIASSVRLAPPSR
jgi:hypothetical protein